MREWRLRNSLILLLVSATLIEMLIVGSGILLLQLPQVAVRNLAASRHDAGELARQLEFFLGGVESQLKPIAKLLANERPVEQLSTYLDTLVGDGDVFDAIYVVRRDGRVEAVGLPAAQRHSGGRRLDYDLFYNPLFEAVRSESRTVWSDKYLSAVTGRHGIGVGMVAGERVLIGEVSTRNILDTVRALGRTLSKPLLVVDRRGEWLADNDPSGHAIHDNFAKHPAVKEALAGQPLPEKIAIDGKEMHPGYSRSTHLQWVFLVFAPAGMSDSTYRGTILLVVGGFVASLLVGIMIAPFWASGVSRPLTRLIEQIDRLARGNYDTRFRRDSSIAEINQLSHDMERMAAAIRSREAEIVRSGERLRGVLDAAAEVAIIATDTAGTITLFNRGAERMLGYAAEEVVGEQPLTRFHLESELNDYGRELGMADGGGAAGFPVFVAMAEREGVTAHEWTYVRKDGSLLRVMLVLNAVRSAPEGIIGYVAIAIDVTEWRRAERALLDSERKLEAVFDASPVPMGVADVRKSFAFLKVNAAWEHQFGLSRDAVIGKNGEQLGIFVSPTDRRQFLQKVIDVGEVRNEELWMLDANGRQMLTQLSARTACIDEAELLIVAYEDITEQRRIEQEVMELNTDLEARVLRRTEDLAAANQELEGALENLRLAQTHLVRSEKLAALGGLVAGVAHELNTPIGNSQMAATSLRDQFADFKAETAGGLRRASFEAFMANVDTATNIVVRNLERSANLVTCFKQLAVDQTSAQRRSFCLKEFVAEVQFVLQPSFKRTPYRIEIDIPDDISLDSYPGPLGQALTNLINNAIAHGFDNRPHGLIRISASTLPEDRIRLLVSDDGVGIPAADLGRIFDPFFTTKRGQGGTGLGLHIVHNTVAQLGGTLTVHSQEGVGTEFEFILPVTAPG